MKRFSLITLALLLTWGASAQTAYDVEKLAGNDLSGTARFVGMGGAMGALGGDISTISTNPAGLGIYRSNDAMISFGFNKVGTEMKYDGQTFSSDKTRGSFDNVGVVVANRFGTQTTLRFVNFGFNYKRVKSFYRNARMSGVMPYSQSDLMVYQANEMFKNPYNSVDLWQLRQDGMNPYDDNRVGWLGSLGFDTGVVMTDDDPDNPYYNIGVQPLSDYQVAERGGIDQFDFNISANLNDRVYLGMTIGATDVNYRKSYFYGEDLGEGESYTLGSENRIEGLGWNVKLGAIFRPIEDSPLRIGLALHTPTFYSLTYRTNAMMNSKLWYVDNNTGVETLEESGVDTFYELYDNDMKLDFDLRTPWLFNVSLGYTVGANLALGAEYEYQDYGSSRLYYPEGDEMYFENDQVSQVLKGAHTLRLGMEYKPISQFAIRLGYNYVGSAFQDNAVKVLPTNSLQVDTDFANAQSLNNYTIGIGYRGSSFYADLAYKYTSQKSDFYPFAFSDDIPAATKMTDSRSQVLMTLGVRF